MLLDLVHLIVNNLSPQVRVLLELIFIWWLKILQRKGPQLSLNQRVVNLFLMFIISMARRYLIILSLFYSIARLVRVVWGSSPPTLRWLVSNFQSILLRMMTLLTCIIIWAKKLVWNIRLVQIRIFIYLVLVVIAIHVFNGNVPLLDHWFLLSQLPILVILLGFTLIFLLYHHGRRKRKSLFLIILLLILKAKLTAVFGCVLRCLLSFGRSLADLLILFIIIEVREVLIFIDFGWILLSLAGVHLLIEVKVCVSPFVVLILQFLKWALS